MIIGLKPCPKWLKRHAKLCRRGVNLSEMQNNYSVYVKGGLLKKIENPVEVVAARIILGSEGFVDNLRCGLTTVSEKINIKRKHIQENQLRSWLNLDDLILVVGRAFNTGSKQILQRHNRESDGRQVAMYLAAIYCRGRCSLTEISEYFNASLSGLDLQKRRLGRDSQNRFISAKRLQRLKRN